MNRNKKIILLAITLLFMLVTCLYACDGTTDKPLKIISHGKSDYSVICSYDATEEVVNASLGIISRANEKANARLKLQSDRNKKAEDSAKEIIIGKTDRGIPERLKPQSPVEFVIGVEGNSVYIVGGCDAATVTGANYFAENIISETTTIDREYVFRNSLPYASIAVNGQYAESLVVEEFDGVDIEKVSKALHSETGLEITEKGDIHIHFEISESVPEHTIRFREYDGKIVVSAKTALALTQVDEIIIENFDKYGGISLANGSYVDFEYSAIDFYDLPKGSECHFECETNRSPLEYMTGDEIIFKLSVKCDDETIRVPYISYKLEFDGSDKVETGDVPYSGGEFEIKTSLDHPGFVKLYVTAASELGAVLLEIPAYDGGAAVGIYEIAQSVKEPEDFDSFWQGELKKLFEVEPVMTVKEDLSDKYPGFTVLDIRIECVGDPVSAYLSIPENAKDKSLGILVGYTGYGVVSPLPNTREDKIVLAVNAHSIDNGKEPGYYNEVASTVLYSYGFNDGENANRDTVYFKNMILRDVQALRYLKTLKEWDQESITLNGGSQGAFQAMAVAALDKDVTYVYAAYPWFCDLGNASTGKIAGWHPRYFDALSYYDTINFARRVECAVRIDAGLGDYVAPPSGVVAMFNAMKCPVTLNFTQGMTHYVTPENSQTFTVVK